MEDWKALYASKLTTADEAVRQIPNGSRVFFGHAANEPPVLVDALVRNYEQYKDVEIVHWVPMGKGEYCDSKMKGHLHHNAMFVGGPTRKAVQEGRADFTPFSSISPPGSSLTALSPSMWQWCPSLRRTSTATCPWASLWAVPSPPA